MGISPALNKTVNEMVRNLKEAIEVRDEAEKRVAEFTNVVRALLAVIDDEDYKAQYLNMLDEVTGKAGFLDMIRMVLRLRPEGLTPTEIRGMIQLSGKMDLGGYSNPLASIHTTLRRMVDSGEVIPFHKTETEKAYRLKPKPPVTVAAGISTPKLGPMKPPPIPPPSLAELKREAEKRKA